MKKCLYCHKDFEPKNPKGKFCSDKCRVYWNRGNNAPKTPETAQKSKNTENSVQSAAKKVTAPNEPKNAPQLTNEQLEEKIKAIRAEVKPSIIGSRQFELYQEKRIDELKKQLK